jgi:hypothetical protein
MTRARSHRSILLAAAVIVVLLAGCDGLGSDADGFAEAREPSDDQPVQSRNALQLRPGPFTEADLHFEPVAVAPGEAFTMSMVGADNGRGVAQVVHRNPGEGDLAVSARFGSIDARRIVVRYRVQRTVVRKDTLSATGPNNEVSVGRSSKEPTSWHYEEVGDQVIVVVDYNEDSSKSARKNGAAPRGRNRSTVRQTTIDPAYAAPSVQCTHVAFVVPKAPSSVEPRGVRMRGAADDVSFVTKRFE